MSNTNTLQVIDIEIPEEYDGILTRLTDITNLTVGPIDFAHVMYRFDPCNLFDDNGDR